jgi:hypothetical protein
MPLPAASVEIPIGTMAVLAARLALRCCPCDARASGNGRARELRQLVGADSRDLDALAISCSDRGDPNRLPTSTPSPEVTPPGGAVTVIMSPRWMKFFIGQAPFVD